MRREVSSTRLSALADAQRAGVESSLQIEGLHVRWANLLRSLGPDPTHPLIRGSLCAHAIASPS